MRTIKRIIYVAFCVVFVLLAIVAFFERDYLGNAIMAILLLGYIFHPLLIIQWKIVEEISFKNRIRTLEAIVDRYSVYVATSDGVEEYITVGQILENEQSGMIIIQLEEI